MIEKSFYFRVIFAGFLLLLSVDCYNLDTENPTIFTCDKTGYYFGYSVALHKNKNQRWLIVGAPLSNENGVGYGAVYKCDLGLKKRTCRIMRDFDRHSQPSRFQASVQQTNTVNDYKVGQWMGATVRSSKSHIMACAPRLAWSGKDGIVRTSLDDLNKPSKKDRKYIPVGKCEVMDFSYVNDTWVWKPCCHVVREASKVGTAGFCSLGFDANFNSDGDGIISGAPSSVDFNGRLFAANLYRPNFLSPSSLLHTKTHDKLGYASVTLKLASGFDLLIGGAPTGNWMIGQVLIFRSTGSSQLIKILRNPSKQIGSYFGSTLAVADVNGDGHQDLLVGAPLFAFDANEGAAYIYVNTGNEIDMFFPPMSLHGDSKRGARFGSSIANVGDLNLDGFQDVAIGAPYEDKGAVYIYSGSRNGLQKSCSQKITPSTFGFHGLPLSTFGSSLSSGVDMDDNFYPDLAIGDFMSDKVVYLRSRPVVTIKSKITLDYTQINQESNNQTCLGADGRRHICLTVTTSFQVGGKGVPLPIGISYTLVVDDQQPYDKRAFFLDGRARSFRKQRIINVTSHKNVEHKVYLLKKPRNVYSPIVFKVTYNYVTEPKCQVKRTLCPTMKPGSAEAMASYTKGCGADLVCSSDLSVKGKIIIPGKEKEVLVGVTRTISLELSVENSKENAYLSKVVVFCPAQLSVIGVHSKMGLNQKWTLLYKNNTHNSLEFNIGNPIQPNEVETYEVVFTVEPTASSIKRLVFSIEAMTSSKDLNLNNNKKIIFANVAVMADITISGIAKPEHLTYNISRTVKDVGPSITHSFLIQNKGPSVVGSSKVIIHFPEKFKKHYVLNLLSISVEGPINCKIDPSMYNPLGIKEVAERKSRKRRGIGQMLDCVTGQCQIFQCDIGRLQRGESATIDFRSSLVDATFSKSIKKSSSIMVTAKVMPNSIRQPSLHFPDKVELIVKVLAPKSHLGSLMKRKSVPWWVILVSVMAGLVLVAGIVFVFHKGGFFNRKKRDYSFSAVPTSAAQRSTMQ